MVQVPSAHVFQAGVFLRRSLLACSVPSVFLPACVCVCCSPQGPGAVPWPLMEHPAQNSPAPPQPSFISFKKKKGASYDRKCLWRKPGAGTFRWGQRQGKTPFDRSKPRAGPALPAGSILLKADPGETDSGRRGGSHHQRRAGAVGSLRIPGPLPWLCVGPSPDVQARQKDGTEIIAPV